MGSIERQRAASGNTLHHSAIKAGIASPTCMLLLRTINTVTVLYKVKVLFRNNITR